jgi:DNA modification methylase
MQLNRIYNEDCRDTMSRMSDNYIDLVVTSPPYDQLRNYQGYCFDFESIAEELFRVIKPGGVLVWIVNDSVKNGSESLVCFRQAIAFNSLGFNLHDTMIYAKNNYIPLTHNRYEQQFEYMFILSKGKPKTFNPLMRDNKQAGREQARSFRQQSNAFKVVKKRPYKRQSIRPNIWFYNIGCSCSSKDKIAFKHPAIFPEQLAEDHIVSWSNRGDLVYEPFMGSGTTAKMTLLNNRLYLGSEQSEEYCEIARERLKSISNQLTLI